MVAIITSVHDRFAATVPAKAARAAAAREQNRRTRSRKLKAAQPTEDHRLTKLVVRYDMPAECWFG